MTVDELKSMPKGHFVVMKTGCHPMKTILQLFFKWGISFEQNYSIEEKAARKVHYANKNEIEDAILEKFPPNISHQAVAEVVEERFRANETFREREAEYRKRKIKTNNSV